MSSKFFIKSYGCQMNSYDSQRMADALISAGYEQSCDTNQCDVIIFNTCSIREKADEKLFSDLGRANLLQSERTARGGSKTAIIVCGCIAQANPEKILKRAPYVDAIIGPQDIHKISSVVSSVTSSVAAAEKKIIETKSNAAEKFAALAPEFYNRSCSEYLTIQEGCDNFCTYCIVPYTRGREVSRDAQDIIQEAKKLISLGVREITLLGQNVNSYRGIGTDGKEWSLARLLFEFAELDGLKRLRYLTSNPKDVRKDIAEAHQRIEILAPFLHLPVQSGSDTILRKMNRKYTVDEYLKCIELLREYKPDIVFSSDFIVGFPGETEADFEDTIKLVEKVKFAQAYSFKYSPREKTSAAKMPDQIPEQIKSERLAILQDILNKQQSEFNKNSVGKCMNVLFVKDGRHKNQLIGRTEYSQAVSVCDTSIRVGDFSRIKITGVNSHSLIGVVE